MQSSFYFLAIIGSLFGLAFLDFQKKLYLFRYPKAWLQIVLTVVFFLIWDCAGIALGIFATNPARVLGLYVGVPNLPLEEFGFLTLMSYLSDLFLSYRRAR